MDNDGHVNASTRNPALAALLFLHWDVPELAMVTPTDLPLVALSRTPHPDLAA